MLENYLLNISTIQQIATIVIAAVAVFGIFNSRWIWKQTNGIIPLLINGNKVSNSFGITSVNEKDDMWKYGSYFSIAIEYKDLE
ncbi:MAG: hypothetical protein AAFY63_14800 [Cyanobacteria bacterium J06643_13]